ncbi:DUF4192 domain-containing protein [Flexivirga sp. B27]
MTSRLRGIGEIVAYLPYQLGYVPRDCLVVVGTREGRTSLTARFERPGSREIGALADQIARALLRQDSQEVLLLCYDGFGAIDRLFVAELRTRLRQAGAHLAHVARVRDDGAQWRVEECSCDGCPRVWSSVPPATDVEPVAESVLRGVVPADDRADLERRYDLRHPLVAAAIGARLGDPDPPLLPTAQVLPRVLLEQQTSVHDLPVEVLASATLAVDSVQVRDQVLSWLMPDFLPAQVVGPPDGSDCAIDPLHLGLPPQWLRGVDPFDDPVAAVARRLEEWVGCVPPPWSVPVLLLSAAVRWTSGNGVLASFAVDRALEQEPGCRLGRLFAAALQAGLRPTFGDEQRPA